VPTPPERLPGPAELERWLREDDPARLEELWRRADEVRRAYVGDEVHLRGIVEVSNHCARQCHYCGLRAGNRRLPRYRMSADDVVASARLVRRLGYGTVVLQSGEDDTLTAEWGAAVVSRIKDATGLAVTLSFGERRPEELRAWRRAGADRYLLRFETSNAALFARVHPPRREGSPSRLELLRELRHLGYEVGSGVMVGLPGQRYADLAADLAYFRELDLDMVAVGPFIPHAATPLGNALPVPPAPPGPDDVPADELTTYKMIALSRLACPEANIPGTTALATVNRAAGRDLALRRGANVIMPDVTPLPYRRLYEIYPAKAAADEGAEGYNGRLRRRLAAMGRRVATGPGGRMRRLP
jgi:biotin synthase